MSRRWRNRKGFNRIKLFICDDLHLLNEYGSILEVVVSRMRRISTQLQDPYRIVGLSLSVADYKEMCEWIGAVGYNFSPTNRTNKITLNFQSFDQSHRPTRISVMLKHLYKQMNHKQQYIIYVSDRKQARLCALDLMAMAVADNNSFIPDAEQFAALNPSAKSDIYLQYTLNQGIAYLYDCMDNHDEQLVLSLYQAQIINVLVVTYKLNYYQLKANNVVILDHCKYNGLEKRYVDYTIPEILTLIESTNHNAMCYLYLHSPKKAYYSKFLYEPLPLESLLNHFLSNHINAEIVAKNIKTTQDCIDWITWTFMYRRLTQNPNYYNLSEVSGTAINNYLSELIENTVEELQEAKCLVVEEDKELDAINSGIIANYYYINVQTVALFTEMINEKSKLQDILHSLSQATEFDNIQIRNSEEIILAQLAKQVPYTPSSVKLNEPNTKAYILLQAHFSRLHLNPDLQYDLNNMLEIA